MPDAGATPLLEVEITRKSHLRGAERVDVINGLRFKLSAGTVTCLLGPSGCGKTTALRIIMGLDPRFEGHILPPGSQIRLGVVFQDPRLLPWRSVDDNVALAAPAQSPADRAALLAELGLADWRRQRPNQLSLGMARRVALARALAVDPDLLILDEAFVSLDERGADTLRAVTFDAVERRRATVLMVTHNVREALEFSDRILVLGPRPTRIIDTLDIAVPRAARSDSWLDTERNRLAASRADFLKIDGA